MRGASQTFPSQLIFVIGCPRSGTTWFANLINAHPDTLYRHEVLGRYHQAFGPLFRKLKFDHGLREEDYASVIRVVMRAEIGTDKPPFFRKRFDWSAGTALRQLSWLAAWTVPMLAPLYARLFTPSGGPRLAVAMKETRSSINLESILAGLRVDKLIVVVRHPYGVVASHLHGHDVGAMVKSNAESRRGWWADHGNLPYARKIELTEDRLLGMSEIEFLALMWRIQNDEFLRIQAAHPCGRVFLYEEFVNDAEGGVEQLLEFLGLPPDDQVVSFVSDSTSSGGAASVLRRDARSEYFSVYRGTNFKIEPAARILSLADLELIDLHTRDLALRLGLGRSSTRASTLAAASGGG